MEYMLAAYTDVGIRKKTNQDCCTLMTMRTPTGNAFFAILCDGMGGLDKGELASATVLSAFSGWFTKAFPLLHSARASYDDYCESWNNLIYDTNARIMNYSINTGTRMGTTLAAVLGFDNVHYVVNVGDSRVYRIGNELEILTKDHSFVAQEVEMHRMTEEEARLSPKRSVLLQCIGASEVIEPFYSYGEQLPNHIYMLCSDGFRNTVLPNEIYSELHPNVLTSEDVMAVQCKKLVDLNIARQENDNITVALVRILQA